MAIARTPWRSGPRPGASSSAGAAPASSTDPMRIVVTRPRPDAERTAGNLRARGHQVLVAPLMRVEPVEADLAGTWSGIVITSANAPAAIADNPARRGLLALPVYAVGRRSAQAAESVGFASVSAADGDAQDLVR